jgi:hypothetical protein
LAGDVTSILRILNSIQNTKFKDKGEGSMQPRHYKTTIITTITTITITTITIMTTTSNAITVPSAPIITPCCRCWHLTFLDDQLGWLLDAPTLS